jgi:hypothetical protein
VERVVGVEEDACSNTDCADHNNAGGITPLRVTASSDVGVCVSE